MNLTTTGVTHGGTTSKIITLNLSHYRKARVWLGELPDISYPIAEIVETTLGTKNVAVDEIRRAAIEMFVPKGGRAVYGLLGAEFSPANTDKLAVQVAISKNNVSGETSPSLTPLSVSLSLVDWALAARIDEVYPGMPLGYANSVLEGVLGAEEILGSGVLRFETAAHGIVSSSRRIFRQLALDLVHLLSYKVESLSEEELTTLFSTPSESRL